MIKFNYDGGTRVVEPHCYGISTAGNEVLRGYQISGYSSSGKMGWKLFDLSKASSINVLNDSFSGPRPGYKTGDKNMQKIIIEL